jgi:hypothetical protein
MNASLPKKSYNRLDLPPKAVSVTFVRLIRPVDDRPHRLNRVIGCRFLNPSPEDGESTRDNGHVGG